MNARSPTVTVSIVGLALLTCPCSAPALQPGREAPALQVTRWLNGDPVRLADGKGKTVYVVHFWSTRSPQCAELDPIYTALQEEFRKPGVVCIAVTGESAETVEKYLKQKGHLIGFRVALDDRQGTFRAYMDAAGVRGIPHAFIVDRSGRIVWHGHPLDEMESVLRRVIAGQYQPGSSSYPAPRSQRIPPEETASELLEKLDRAYQLEDWERALGYLDRLMELDPEDRRFPMVKLHLLVTQLGDVRRATEWGLTLVEAHREDVDFLNELSWRLLTTGDYGKRCMELAYKAALAADRAAGESRYDITDTLARALYQMGRLDEAIRLQEKALRLAEERDAEQTARQELSEVLRYYRDCADLHDRAAAPEP